METLQKMSLGEIFPQLKNIITVYSASSIESVLKTLKENNILAVPVVDTFNNAILGVVDMGDITAYIVDRYPKVESITADQLGNLEYDGIRFAKDTTINEVLSFAKTNLKKDTNLYPIQSSKSVLQLMERFILGFEKVPILSDDQKMVHFISQSDLLRYLAQNMFLIGDKGKFSLADLKLGVNPVTYVREDIVSVSALQLMSINRVNAVPVVDGTGKLIANFSNTDLRGLGPGDFHQLLLSVKEYLATSHPKSLYPLTCSLFDTFEAVLFKLVATKVHRLWCVNDEGKVIGVITTQDLLKSFFGMASEMIQ